MTWRQLSLNESQRLALPNGTDSGLTVSALPIPGKLQIHLGDLTPDPEDNIALQFTETGSGKTLAYLPARRCTRWRRRTGCDRG